VGGSDAKGAAAALRRLAAQEAAPVPLHLVAATPGRLRALLALEETPLNMTLGYGSIPINTIFSGMNIHLPAWDPLGIHLGSKDPLDWMILG